MKKLILSFATASLFFTACNTKEKQTAAAQRVKQATMDSMAYANKQQHTIDSLRALTNATSLEAAVDGPAMTPIGAPGTKAPTRKKITRVNTEAGVNTPANPSTAQTQGQTANSEGSASGTKTVAPEKKKGLNNAAKGAIIGLGTGAAAGAIIGKENRGKGAVVGGIVGAIGGAVGGAVIDKRKEKKQAEKDSVENKK